MLTLAIVIAILGAYHNYLINLPSVTIFPSLFGALLGLFFFYRSRIKGYYHNAYVYLLAGLTIIIISIVFFYNSGSAGPMIILHVCLFNIYILISNGRHQYYILIILLLHVSGLYYLEYTHPQWLSYYTNPKARFIDVLVTFTYATIFMTFATLLFKKYYNKEQKRVEQQKQELEKLYKTISGQNVTLMTQKEGLEKSLEEIRDKNKFISDLMRELNHRVKNNLQLVTSLLNMQASQSNDEHARNSIQLAKNRIIGIGLIHQKLYQDNLELNLDMANYISELSSYLVQTALPDEIELELNLKPVNVNIETAVHVGLIVNELITNSIKHAWSMPEGNRKISIETNYDEKSGSFQILHKDNGKGFSKPKEKLSAKSYGLDLIESIVEQYNGKMQQASQKGGVVSIYLIISKN